MATYTVREKYEAVIQLIANLGDVDKTSEQLNIPRSTLFDWKNKLKSNEDFVSLDYSTRSVVIIERYNRVRDKILVQLERLADEMTVGEERYLSDYALAFARLADRIDLLENIILKTGHYEIAVAIEGITLNNYSRLAILDEITVEPD